MLNYIFEHTIWKVIDGHWINIERTFKMRDQESHKLFEGVLCEYLWILGFDIPETIKYCLAENETTKQKIKFRQHGGLIHVYATPLK